MTGRPEQPGSKGLGTSDSHMSEQGRKRRSEAFAKRDQLKAERKRIDEELEEVEQEIQEGGGDPTSP